MVYREFAGAGEAGSWEITAPRKGLLPILSPLTALHSHLSSSLSLTVTSPNVSDEVKGVLSFP